MKANKMKRFCRGYGKTRPKRHSAQKPVGRKVYHRAIDRAGNITGKSYNGQDTLIAKWASIYLPSMPWSQVKILPSWGKERG